MEISGYSVVLAIAAVVMAYISHHAFSDGDTGVGLFLTAIAVMFSVLTYYETRPETRARRDAEDAEKAKVEAALRQPHVIREVDGCKVYRFKADDRLKYFTRCPNMTTTEFDHVVICGKNCTKVISESIEVKQ